MNGIRILLLCLVIHSQHFVSGAESDVDDLVARFFEWRLENSPEFGTKFGINNHDDKLEQYTEEAFDTQQREAAAFLVEAGDTEGKDAQEEISLAILKDLLQNFIDGYQFREYSIYNFVSPQNNPFKEFTNLIGWSKFNTEIDYNNYISRLNLIPTQIDQVLVLMQKAVDKGTTQPIPALAGVVENIQEDLAKTSTESVFYAPFNQIPDSIAEDIRSGLQQRGQAAVENTMWPAWTKYINFMQNTYTPAARTEIGASSLPNGSAYYDACLSWHLSVSMTPRDIHDTGVREVARIIKEMEKIMRDDGFAGTLQEYKALLEADPTNYYNTSEEILQGYRDFIAATHDKVQTVLKTVPDMEIQVAAKTNPYGSIGSYTEPPLDGSRPGIFYANAFFPEEKPKFNMYALALHEAEPGHHTQTAVGIENHLPEFRRAIEYRKYAAVPFNWLFHTAYSEGWALYAEALGEDMGAYTEKHALFGRYAGEIHRAARLVVDTGIHAFGWSHERAVNYLLNTTTLSQNSVVNEINRYVAWPGQACAYKIGELKIKALKEKAKEKLGGKFDQREFHDQVLLLGNSPLHVLEDHINAWISGLADDPTSAAPSLITAAANWLNLTLLIVCCLMQ